MSDIGLDSRPALAKHVRMQVDKVSGQTVLLYPEGILELNPTAEAILRRCDGKSNVAEIVAALVVEYEANEEELRGDVLECLGQLGGRNFVVFEVSTKSTKGHEKKGASESH
jgi:pyrroloquinoline quinone biosynthesis protein D